MLPSQIIYVNLTTSQITWVTNGASGDLQLPEGVAPSTVASTGQLYVKATDHNLYFKNNSGTETQITPAAAPTGTQIANRLQYDIFTSDGSTTSFVATNTVVKTILAMVNDAPMTLTTDYTETATQLKITQYTAAQLNTLKVVWIYIF